MAETFEDLGLRPELVEAAGIEGYTGPTSLQRAAIPVLRRGGNAVLHASAGAGLMAAYGLPLVDRLAGAGPTGEEAGVRAVVLVPTDEDATRTASSLARFAHAVGLRASALGPGWAPPAVAAEIVVASPGAAIDAVQTSRLKLERVEAFVVDGASAIFALGRQEAVETLTGLIPKDAQRIVTAGERSREVEDYTERHVRRALHIPPTPIEEPQAAPAAERRPVDYVVVIERERLDTVATILAQRPEGQQAVVYCRTEARADTVAEELALRGFRADRTVEGDVVVAVSPEDAPAGGLAISYDAPFDADDLDERHQGGGVVLITPRELPHLRLIAERGGYLPRARSVAAAPPALDEIAVFRDQVRRAAMEQDLAAQLLVLEPLFAEFSPAEVAAAVSALLRERPARAEAPAAAPARAGAPAAPAPAPAFVRLFIGVGARDGVGPGDLVGAITGEANVQGSQVGKIDVRDTFSVVEVASSIAEKVIQAMNGITLKGRSVRVDYDRRSMAAPRGGERPRRRIPRDFGR